MMALQHNRDTRLLSQLLEGLAVITPEVEREITSLTIDSRRVVAGSLFLACSGLKHHGERFIDAALKAGAVAVAVEADTGDITWRHLAGGKHVPLIPVPALGRRAGEIADRFYHHPSAAMRVIGVTGTNGKTSVSQFIGQALHEQTPCGIVGTLGSGLVGALQESGHTTPDAVSLHASLAEFLAAGAQTTVMEVSSHGLDQGRVNGVSFDTAVFTNLSRDHLDYHGDMESYAAAKRRLLELPGVRHAVLNLDDPVGRQWWQSLPSGVEGVGYSLLTRRAEDEGRAVIYGSDLQLSSAGMTMRIVSPWGKYELHSGLLGRFNASNLLATLGALLTVGVGMMDALARLTRLQTVPGRMERFGGEEDPLVVVDYAHTPDALEQVLSALREHCSGRLWCVFGCGGDRDRGKRPLMGAVAEREADRVIVTDDNSRHEDPHVIVEQILDGMANPERADVIRDRREAIASVLAQAEMNDVVLVAGKGHERCQWVGDACRPFNDAEVVEQLLQKEARDG